MSVFDRIRQMQAQKSQRSAAVTRGGIGEGTPEWDALSTEEKTRRYMAEGQDAAEQGIKSLVSAAMPQFQDELQGIRESAIRRGVDLGDIGTRNEGSLASAFQRNIANTAGQLAGQNYQTALDRTYGYRDYRTAQDEAKANRRASTLGTLGGLAGMAAATPLGAAVGSKLGGFFAGTVSAGDALNATRNTSNALRGMRGSVNIPNVGRASGWGR